MPNARWRYHVVRAATYHASVRFLSPIDAIEKLPPPGRWGVGVSGGADSVALLELMRGRDDVEILPIHLDHETRGGASGEDARFVRELAREWSLRCISATRSGVERLMGEPPSNRSARYRAARLKLFSLVVAEEKLDGVVLAHHADDQAETVVQRLLRGSGPAGLVGMRADAIVSGVRIIRPLLMVRREALREMLRERGTPWREDASNEVLDQQRNRVRKLLASRPPLTEAAIELAEASAALVAWLRACGPELDEVFDVRELHHLPRPLAREAARRWLAAHTPAGEEIAPAAAERLVEMATDAASPARQHFPGGVLVRRRGGRISVEHA
jgi:tRNA(Ile)-lysidine synthase